MIDLAADLAVQSWCFRHFKNHREAIRQVQACGLDRIELSRAHVDFTDEASFPEVIGLYRDAGMTITSIGAVPITPDAAASRRLFEFVRLAGAGLMTVNFPVDGAEEAFGVAERLAEEYDVRLGIHNHGGRHWLGNAQMLAHVFATTNERIGLTLDTAWALDAGEDPVALADRFADRLYGLHLKDFVFDRAGRGEDVVVGTGNLDLPRLRETLEAADFSGEAILEYEADVEDPAPAITKCVEAVRKGMAS